MVGYGQGSIKFFPEHLVFDNPLRGRAIKQFAISYLTKVIGTSES